MVICPLWCILKLSGLAGNEEGVRPLINLQVSDPPLSTFSVEYKKLKETLFTSRTLVTFVNILITFKTSHLNVSNFNFLSFCHFRTKNHSQCQFYPWLQNYIVLGSKTITLTQPKMARQVSLKLNQRKNFTKDSRTTTWFEKASNFKTSQFHHQTFNLMQYTISFNF